MAYDWESYSDDRLLQLRFRDLKLKIPGSRMEKYITRLYDELASKRIRFQPHFWIGLEWFVPDGVPGIALPFYLLNRKLMKLEEAMVLEVEGGNVDWCMRLLRHETAHALDNAYKLRMLKKRQQLFGLTATPYPESYAPKPYSRSYVVNLDAWYAQAHPDEDWAETFAVWLNPKSAWKKRYAKWPAIKKLRFIDEVMQQIRSKRPLVSNRYKPDAIHTIKKTLKSHYRAKRKKYGLESPSFFEQDLYLIFSDREEFRRNPRGDIFIKKHRKQIRQSVAKWTGHYQYAVNDILNEVIDLCRKKHLHLKEPANKTKLNLIGMLIAQTMNYMISGANKIPM